MIYVNGEKMKSVSGDELPVNRIFVKTLPPQNGCMIENIKERFFIHVRRAAVRLLKKYVELRAVHFFAA